MSFAPTQHTASKGPAWDRDPIPLCMLLHNWGGHEQSYNVHPTSIEEVEQETQFQAT